MENSTVTKFPNGKVKKEESPPVKNTNLGIDLREKSKNEKEILANSLLSYSEEEQEDYKIIITMYKSYPIKCKGN